MAVSLETIKKASETLKVIGHPARLRIIELLENSELPVKEIQEKTNMPQPAVSQHLSLMRSHGIVKFRRNGHQVFYSLNDNQVKRILKCLQDCSAKSS